MISEHGKAVLRTVVMAGTRLTFGPMVDRSPAEWAQWHSGMEFITPQWERDALLLMARGETIDSVAELAGIRDYEVEDALGRAARTLATYERNACKWSTRYVAVEPMACATDGASERDQRRERMNRKGAL